MMEEIPRSGASSSKNKAAIGNYFELEALDERCLVLRFLPGRIPSDHSDHKFSMLLDAVINESGGQNLAIDLNLGGRARINDELFGFASVMLARSEPTRQFNLNERTENLLRNSGVYKAYNGRIFDSLEDCLSDFPRMTGRTPAMALRELETKLNAVLLAAKESESSLENARGPSGFSGVISRGRLPGWGKSLLQVEDQENALRIIRCRAPFVSDDRQVIEEFRTRLRAAVEGSPGRVVINLDRVQKLDSESIGELVNIWQKFHKASRDAELKICCPPGELREKLSAMRLVEALPILESEEEARAQCA